MFLLAIGTYRVFMLLTSLPGTGHLFVRLVKGMRGQPCAGINRHVVGKRWEAMEAMEAMGQPDLRSLFFSTGHLFERYNHSQKNDDADQDVPDCRPRMRLSGDELETPQVALRPTGLIFNHCFERLGRKSAEDL